MSKNPHYMCGPIPTLNRCGYQMGFPSPLLHNWLESYDGKHPLLDIGCAYGINTFKAIEKGIPTVALDPEAKHLESLRERLVNVSAHLVTCTVGSLPCCIDLPDNSVSGILCSEVLHFLDGSAVEKSIKTMYKKMVPGGKLVLTTLSTSYLKQIFPEKEINICHDLEAGVKWPGLVECDDEYLERIEKLTLNKEMQSNIRTVFPEFLHFLSGKQVEDELIRCGFVVKDVSIAKHPGHPDVTGTTDIRGHTLQVVAEKMLS